MKKKRTSVERITSVLPQVATGLPVGDVCRQVGNFGMQIEELLRARMVSGRSVKTVRNIVVAFQGIFS